jgi:hypothetical protein
MRFLKEVGERCCRESNSAGFDNWCNRGNGGIRRGDNFIDAVR